MEFPDVHHKMSKKIAQLTKVIYHLNTKNDDNEYQMQQITNLYECEIEDILADAKKKILDFKEALEIQKNDNRAALAIDELTKMHDREREEARQEFTSFKKRAQNNEAILRSQCEEQVSALTNDLQAVKDQFQSKLQTFVECQKGLEQKGYDSLEELRKMKDAELENTVQEYNEKYKSMLAKQLQAQEDLETSLTKQADIKLSTLRSEHEQHQQRLNEEISSLKHKLKQASQESDNNLQANRDQSVKMAQLEDLIKEHRANEERLNNTIQSHIKKLNDGDEDRKLLDRKISTQANTIQQHEDTIRTWQQSCEREKSEKESLKETIKEQQSKIDGQGKQIASLLSEIQLALENNENTTSKMNSDLSEHVGEIAHLRSLLTEAENEKQRLSELSFTQKQDIDALQKQIELSNLDGAASVKAHQDEIVALKEAMKNQEDEHAKKASDIQSACDVRLTELRDQFETKFQNSEREWEEKVAALNKKHETATRSQDDAHNTTLSSHQSTIAKLKQEIEALKSDLSNQRQSMESATSHSNSQLADVQMAKIKSEQALKDLIESTKKELTQKEEELDAANKKVTDLQNDVAQLQADATAALAARDTYEEQQQKKYDELLQQQQLQQQELSQLTQTELVKLKDELLHERARIEALQEELSTSRRNFAMAKQQLRDDLEKTRSLEIQRQTATWNQREETLQNELNDLQLKLSDLEEKLQSEEKSSSESSEAFKFEKAKLIAEHKRQEAELKQAFATDVDSLTGKLKEEAKEKNRQLTESHENALGTLRRHHEEAIRTLNENHNKELATLRSSNEKDLSDKLASAKADHAEALNALRTSTRTEFESELQKQRLALEATLSSKQDQLRKYISDIASLDNQKTQLSKDLEMQAAKACTDITRLQSEIASLREQHAADISEMKTVQEDALRTQSEKHTDLVTELRNEFADTKAAMAEKRHRLENAIADLEYRYANRESRQEDVDKVNELMREMSVKDAALVKAYNDLRWHQLELANREENYNKVFGRQPTVAFGMKGPTAAGPQLVADSRKNSISGLDKTKLPPPGRAMSLVVNKSTM
eukprot:TRINITY_DN1653_c2_g2_i1.p1 TRINITY_DN1653_c2_g2~~TRINITY_DN1653_c2_g2_i1.p1  ORF type:complete len:1064 (+),score=322.04 TRINITY_DN1653_c2_g2_i1:162-3353(+)